MLIWTLVKLKGAPTNKEGDEDDEDDEDEDEDEEEDDGGWCWSSHSVCSAMREQQRAHMRGKEPPLSRGSLVRVNWPPLEVCPRPKPMTSWSL